VIYTPAILYVSSTIWKINRDTDSMELIEILRELKIYGIYDEQQWVAYLNSFSDDVRRNPTVNDVCLQRELARRIRFGEHGPREKLDRSISPKIVTADYFSAKKVRSEIRLGVVSGSYDLLHLGHIKGMQYAKSELNRKNNAKLCALTLSDENIRLKKGPGRPVLNTNERLRMITAVRHIDYVILLEDPDCISMLQCLPVDCFFKAKDDMGNEILRQEVEAVRSGGGTLQLFPDRETRITSTTEIITKISEAAAKR
jgi:D-beta-D-heptose 7-phosphate kinase/D-beta-D-heptose 1-phosphate adenosyltransferase